MADSTTPKRRSRSQSTIASVGEGLGIHIGLGERSLRSANRSARTVQVYLESARQLERFLEAASLPTAPAALRREHIEAWIEDLLARCKPATASVRFRSVQQFFKFLVEEGEIDASPMRTMRPPIVPEQPVAVATEELERLIRSVSGRTFAERRDLAIIRLFLDTGMRISELARLRVVGKRAKAAGLPHIHPHQLRHTFAHASLDAGGSEGGLMAWPAGGRGPCSAATPPPPPTSGPNGTGLGRLTLARPAVTRPFCRTRRRIRLAPFGQRAVTGLVGPVVFDPRLGPRPGALVPPSRSLVGLELDLLLHRPGLDPRQGPG